MLTEYALTPDIFDASCYSKPELYNPLFSNLIKPLLEEGIVRNLRGGEWIKYVSNYVNNETSTLYPIAKDFLKKLILTNRLRHFHAISDNGPKNYQEWCGEAFRSNDEVALNGIIVSEEIKKDRQFRTESKIGSIEKLYLCNWWKKRSSSTRVSRSIEDYMDKLNLVLSHANHLMFIDPNIDPGKGNYKDFYRLLIGAKRPDPQPIIEIHRKLKSGSGGYSVIIDAKEWEEIFRRNLAEILAKEGLNAEVFIWNEFHDRYLISNIIGINLPYGFDTTTRVNAKTTWCRLGRNDRDDVQKEFTPTSLNHYKLKHRFFIVP